MADSRIQLYHNLSVLLAAGMPITRSLQSVQKQGKIGRLFTQISQDVSTGQSLLDAVNRHDNQFSSLDLILIEVGEQTGQMAEVFEALSQWYAFRQKLLRAIRSGMLLPVLYIHATAFIVPVVACALNEFNPMIYVRGVLTILAMFYIPAALAAAIIFLTPKQGPLRQMMDRVLLAIPLLGAAIRDLELGRFSKIFAITYKSGIPILRCAEFAMSSLKNRVIFEKLKGSSERVRLGEEMSTGFSASLPGEFLGLWQTGEQSGDLDEAARRLGEIYSNSAEQRFITVAQWATRLSYAFICIIMMYYIFKGYSMIFDRAYSF